jgi:hypothetical protein
MGIVRINSDGSLDESWMPNGNPDIIGGIRGWSLLPNGKIIVSKPLQGGNLTKYAILSEDGEFEQFFSFPISGGGLISDPRFAESISNNEMLIWGAGTVTHGVWGIYNFDNASFQAIAKGAGNYNTWGIAREETQIPVRLNNGDWITPVRKLPTYNNIPGGALKVSSNLSSWQVFPEYFNSYAKTAAVDASNKILLGGHELFSGDTLIESLIRMDENGVRDLTFDTSESISKIKLTSQRTTEVEKVIVLPDGKILVGGGFLVPSVEGRVDRRNLVRLNEDGSIDTTFRAI